MRTGHARGTSWIRSAAGRAAGAGAIAWLGTVGALLAAALAAAALGSAGTSVALVAAPLAPDRAERVVLPLPPAAGRAARALAVTVFYDPETAEPGWITLEGFRASPDDAGRRRVLPGSNRLLWELPPEFAGREVALRGVPAGGSWRVDAARLLPAVGVGVLAPLSGLVLALALGLAVLVRLLAAALGRMVAGGTEWRPGPGAVALTAILALALALRVYSLEAQGFWLDEVLTLIGAQSLGWLLYTPQVFEHPPLQYLIVWAVRHAAEREWVIRLPFLLAGVAGVGATAWLGRVLVGRPAALVAAALVALSPFHVNHSQTARPYALVALLSALALGALWRALEGNRAAAWLGVVAAASLLCYAHYLGLLVVALMALAALAWPARWREAGLAFGLVALLYLPWLPVVWRQWTLQRGAGTVTVDGLWVFLRQILLPELVGDYRLAWVGAAFGLAGLVACRRDRRRLGLFVLWVAGPFLAIWLVRPAHFLASRHFIFLLPVFACLVGRGVIACGRWVAGRGPRPLSPPPAAASWRLPARWARAATVGLAFVLTAAPSAAGLRVYYETRRGADWRAVARVLRETVREDDRVQVTEEAYYPLRHYYGDRIETLDLEALQRLTRRRRPGQRVWVLYHADFGTAPDEGDWLARHGRLVQSFSPSWSLRESRLYLLERTRTRAGGRR